MIQLHKVVKRFRGETALAEIDLNIGDGEMAFVTGHSGAGKSTLLRLIAAIERPDFGQVFVNGRDITRLARAQIPYLRRRIGFVFQNHRLLFDRPVFDNVALPLRIGGAGRVEAGKRVRAALDKVGLLGKEALNPAALSAGQQQRVGIARAIVNRPLILLADEPTGNLDPELSREIMNLFSEFNRAGTTTLVASHDLALIGGLGHRVITLHEGRLAGAGE